MDKEFIKSNIEKASAEASAHGAALCAVIKTRSNEEIDFALGECSVHVVGENRVQELLDHYPTLKKHNAEIHFIGHLQKNKVKYLADKVDMIESLDSVALAEEIERQFSKVLRRVDALIEINIGREEQKSGILPEQLDAFLDELGRFEHINVRGLMTVAPKCENVSEYDLYFAATKKLFDGVFMKKRPGIISPVLSMGMSESYPSALKFGTTEIRLGTKIFGKRPDTAKK